MKVSLKNPKFKLPIPHEWSNWIPTKKIDCSVITYFKIYRKYIQGQTKENMRLLLKTLFIFSSSTNLICESQTEPPLDIE